MAEPKIIPATPDAVAQWYIDNPAVAAVVEDAHDEIASALTLSEGNPITVKVRVAQRHRIATYQAVGVYVCGAILEVADWVLVNEVTDG